MQQTVNAVIIDGGICNKGDWEDKILSKINFIEENEHVTHDRLAVVHGTTCAEIITRICPGVKFWDLTAMCPDGTAELSNLLEALEWCIQNKIKLIHLSLGTVNYFDIKPLEEKIGCLIDQNAIIVAAYHNQNIKTYPAAFPGVFGVRQDRDGILGEYEFLFQEQEGFECENSIVAHWWGEDGENRANSYAAPVVTGYVARILQVNGQADFPYVLEALKKKSVSDKKYPNNINNVIQKNGDISIPVIAGMGLGHGDMQVLIEKFENNGYYTLLLGEDESDISTIPLEYYGGKHILLRQILYTVDIVYKADIIFLDFHSRKTYDASKEADIDIVIFHSCDMYLTTAGSMLETSTKPEDIFDIICRYFT